jgi:hypothetical protein
MDPQTVFLLALSLLVVAGLAVSVAGWILFVRDRHAGHTAFAGATASPGSDAHHEVAEER